MQLLIRPETERVAAKSRLQALDSVFDDEPPVVTKTLLPVFPRLQTRLNDRSGVWRSHVCANQVFMTVRPAGPSPSRWVLAPEDDLRDAFIFPFHVCLFVDRINQRAVLPVEHVARYHRYRVTGKFCSNTLVSLTRFLFGTIVRAMICSISFLLSSCFFFPLQLVRRSCCGSFGSHLWGKNQM